MSIRLSTSVLPVSRVSSSASDFLVALQQVGDPVQQRGAIGHRGRRPRPVVERRPARRRHGVARVVGGGLVDDGGDTAVGRVDDVAGAAVGGMTPLTADVEVGFTVHRSLTLRR